MARTRTTLSASNPTALNGRRHVSLCETLDRVLHKGAVVAGELTISVADVDLVYLSLQLIVTSIEKARELSMIGERMTDGDRLYANNVV